jgi:hypothetical protein
MKRALVGLMVAAVAAMGAMGGMAASPQNVKLQFFTSHPNGGVATATAGWVNGTDSDADNTFVKITTRASGTGSFAGFISHGTALDTGTVTVSGMTNLAFAMDSNFVGAGAPRYSIELNDGNVIFASAIHCGATADSSLTVYQTVTFLSGGNGNASCTFFWSGGPISGGTWADVKAAFPTQTVKKVVMVQDEGPAEVHLDKIVVQNCTYTTNTGATCS